MLDTRTEKSTRRSGYTKKEIRGVIGQYETLFREAFALTDMWLSLSRSRTEDDRGGSQTGGMGAHGVGVNVVAETRSLSVWMCVVRTSGANRYVRTTAVVPV